jgi:hypothetical protein
MSHVSRKYGQFTYFDRQLGHPVWRGKRVLDFGGNCGNILRAPECEIDHASYWCVDISPDGLAAGRRDFPQAHWIWYDRYNISFHPAGSRSAPIPRFDHAFDYILAYSVFTHMELLEMDQTAAQLLPMLNPGGAFAFTFIDPHFHSWPGEYPGNNLIWRLEKMRPRLKSEVAAIQSRVGDSACFTLIGDGEIYDGAGPIPGPERYHGLEYHVYHTAEFMHRRFPAGKILPPSNYEMQHCCILRKAPGLGAPASRA